MNEIEEVFTREEMTFEEAVDYFKEKVPVTPGQFKRLSEKYKSLAFTVSGYTSAQILNKFYEEILIALEDGSTLYEFRTNINKFLKAEGYEGITPFQADNIFRTNIQTAYNAGHYERMTDPDILALRPYWQYRAVGDEHTRPSHLALDGKVFPADDPFWDTWYPPNGFRCRCTVSSLSERQVKSRGLTVEHGIPQMGRLPDGRNVSIMPDPSFSTNPAKVRFEPDLKGYPKSLVKAYQNREKENAPP